MAGPGVTQGSLYVVSTPIGNLEDITYRAVRVLGDCDLVLAEDTRRTAVLLRAYGIETRLLSAHEHNEEGRARQLVDWLGQGRDVALVSDAGTPLVSDPGARIVGAAIEAGAAVVPIPGPSAILSALVISGLPVDRFRFAGFPPRKRGEREALLDEIAASPDAVVLYEAPNRLVSLLEDMEPRLGGGRRVVVARELTKMHEEVTRGTVREVRQRWETDEVRGEVAVVVEGATRAEGVTDEADREAASLLAAALFERGLRHKEVVRELRRRLGISRNDAYEIAGSVRDGGAAGARGT